MGWSGLVALYSMVGLYLMGFVMVGGGGVGVDSCGKGGGDGWLKERDSEKEINIDGGEGWERDWISINLLGSYIILIS